MRIFVLQGIKNPDKFMLGSNEDSDNFTGESKMRISNLLGEFESCGEESLLLESKWKLWGSSYTAGE